MLDLDICFHIVHVKIIIYSWSYCELDGLESCLSFWLQFILWFWLKFLFAVWTGSILGREDLDRLHCVLLILKIIYLWPHIITESFLPYEEKKIPKYPCRNCEDFLKMCLAVNHIMAIHTYTQEEHYIPFIILWQFNLMEWHSWMSICRLNGA